MPNNVHELKPRLFDSGEVSITAEAFQRLKEAQVEPELLLERHTRGDWRGGPVKWIERGYPVWSVYQLHPSEHRVCLITDQDFSRTKIINWPDGTNQAPLLPLKAMEAGHQATKRAMERSSFARSLLEENRPKGQKEKQKPHGEDRGITR
jgi:hypothetical protein